MTQILPNREKRKKHHPTSLRIPDEMLKRLDVAARSTGNTRSETVLSLLKWALEKYEKAN